MGVTKPAPYDSLAGEYYNPAHKTSRNFDAATLAGLDQLDHAVPDGPILEPGCGRGRCGEFLRIDTATRVVQLDNSLPMLQLANREVSALRVLHDAESLPFPDAEFSTVAAFLCDPFLGLNFLHEARRVLRAGGLLLGSTPTDTWGMELRNELDVDPMETRFILEGGGQVRVPSALYSALQLREMLELVGFGDIEISSHSLPAATTPVSPDIAAPARRQGVSEYALPIVYIFSARR